MGYPAYYGRPALVAGRRRQSPAPVRAVSALHYLAALATLAAAVAVAAIWRGQLSWSAVTGPLPQVASPPVRQAVAQRGLTIALALTLAALAWLALARNLRRGRRWSRVVVLAMSGAAIGATLYGMARGYEVNVVAGLTVPVLSVLLLYTRSARSWFRWGSY